MSKTSPIAVVGMAGIFPGAIDLETFWRNILHKVDTTDEVPKERWIIDSDSVYQREISPDKACSKRACLVKDFKLDLHGLDIPPDLLTALDPLYHMAIHAGREALSCCSVSAIDKKNTGVILSAIALPTDTASRIAREILGASFEKRLFSGISSFQPSRPPLSPAAALAARVNGFPAAILAAVLNLGGGSYTLDAACASSLYAVKLACDELQSGRSDLMLAGGVSRPDSLYTQVGFSQLQTLSPSGRCAPFDKRADGLVVGEGTGILVLKRLEDALRDKDTILCLIRGIGLSNDMGGNLLTPYRTGQLRAMQSAYVQAGWSPQDIDLIECHGTGTPVGDLEEISSLAALWGESGWTPGQCAIGSVKSMVGHLLTAAGAAGMIKTILALNRRVLPPSIHFEHPPDNSPLINSPFRVQTEASPWPRRVPESPLRAAVSAFGFGGINAHLLLEEWDSEESQIHPVPGHLGKREPTALSDDQKELSASPLKNGASDIAVVGMASVFGTFSSLNDFKEAIFTGSANFRTTPEFRWKGCENIARDYLRTEMIPGGFLDEVSVFIGDFHIQPNEMNDMLPQHLLILKVAADAMTNAGFSIRPHKESKEERSRMGVVIGMGFDFEATNFSRRWNLLSLVPEWENRLQLNLSPPQRDRWLQSLKDTSGPPLTASRTVGALGGIIASRIAKEFLFGGPSFTVSCEEASGLKALEIGVRSLQQGETDLFLVGAVDLPGDIRNMIITDTLRPYARGNTVSPFDHEASGTLPGEGAAAIVLKRLDQAIADNDRIYSVIKGIGKATCGAINMDGASTNPSFQEAYRLSLERVMKDANIPPASISLIEAHGSGVPEEDTLELEALSGFFDKLPPGNNHSSPKAPMALGSVKANIGHTGAASGLASIVKTCLSLYHEIIPPLKEFSIPFENPIWQKEIFHVPMFPQYWARDRKLGPRRALAGAFTPDGNISHVLLEGHDPDRDSPVYSQITAERKRPLGEKNSGLFVVEAESKENLIKHLDRLMLHVRQSANTESSVDWVARSWFEKNKPQPWKKYALSIVAGDLAKLVRWITEAKEAVTAGTPKKISGPDGVKYAPTPVGKTGDIAFVFPGSGNDYIGMGRGIGVVWPEILREMDARTLRLKTQLIPHCYTPWRCSWGKGWETDAYKTLVSDPMKMIFGQVTHGAILSNLVQSFKITPSAVIGYSLGESAGLFALGAWPERGEMLERLEHSDLFRTVLAGPCTAARRVWNLPPDEKVEWCVAAINRPADVVKQAIRKVRRVYLLIVNTPDECVIGGQKKQVETAIDLLGCEAVFLEGVVTVHCEVAVPAREAYKELHSFSTHPPEGIRFYSCTRGKAYPLTTESTASSILNQALYGFDFTETINQAYKDGVRLFLEMGPHSSCTRMITRILEGKPHLAVSACARGEDDYLTFLKFLGALAAERAPIALERLYGKDACPEIGLKHENIRVPGRRISLMIGGKAPFPALPAEYHEIPDRPEPIPEPDAPGTRDAAARTQERPLRFSDIAAEELKKQPRPLNLFTGLSEPMAKTRTATAEAHDKFLDFSSELSTAYAKTVEFQSRLIQQLRPSGLLSSGAATVADSSPIKREPHDARPIAFSRDMCLEFAVGSAAKVLGPEFAVVDSYNIRVRLPDEPLMFVDRILSIEGQKGSLGPGSIVTEHDVLPGAWYLDGGRAPVCISIEAGQADLFLCSYLGIDLAVKGKRSYRLLDAVATFHAGLPKPGDTLRYEIEIEKFIRQGETYLFFFNFKGFIKETQIISMSGGCAGFFTPDEVKNSGGILLTPEETLPVKGKRPPDWTDLVPFDAIESYDDRIVDALRRGEMRECFGPDFDDIRISDSIRLPGGRMKLIDRIIEIDPHGGRYGLGRIRAESDIHPGDWFLTCHFVDDRVMPGTLMYECCAHALRVFVQRMGWVSEKKGVCYEPVPGVPSVLKCRGPVTPETKKVVYEVEIKELGYSPEPFVIADAMIYVDDTRSVSFKDMSLKMSGTAYSELKAFWKETLTRPMRKNYVRMVKKFFNRDELLAFALGNPSDAFGEPYKIFDKDRVVARLPSPPYSFIDQVHYIEPEPWVLKPGGWIEAQYSVSPDEWFFRANRSASAPYCIINEIALQACGFLAAYAGSSLKSKKDLKFRNLGGNATLFQEVTAASKALTMRARMTKVSEAADMIIEQFDMQVFANDQPVYTGDALFGFFTKEALAQQAGIRDAEKSAYHPSDEELRKSVPVQFEDIFPLTPDDTRSSSGPPASMPAKAIRMVDRIDLYIPNGGPSGLGFIRGSKTVDPAEWFFKAHFYQDPVCPGSLGLESFLQLLKFMAIDRFQHLVDSHAIEHVKGNMHHWIYRGQILPNNKRIEVEAMITEISDMPVPRIMANGYLKVDGLYIYQMERFGIMMVPIHK